jgi:chromosome segregation protein
MRLKRVRLFGFKTFADRTEFALDGGIVAVVGPNGCGKSNLVDAILWGLGEGNARQLRAATGHDVIFNGSARRKPVGFTEVNLLFDNEDGGLPIESSEVAISRRLTRSGDSEYAINRQTCRLRDVYDLLADSGLGRSGYAIVGQKEIDQALAASADERRAWIDEAAGVQRYRARKNESLKRLAAAKEHLSRVEDILSELERQREPLRKEAEDAARYKGLVGTLRELELGLLAKELRESLDEIEACEQRIAEAARISIQELERAEVLEGKVRTTGERISEVEQEMDAVRDLQQRALTAIERAEANIRVAEQKIANLDELELSLNEDAATGLARLQEAEREAQDAALELDREKVLLEELSAAMAGAGDSAKAFREELDAADDALRAARQAEVRRLKLEAEKAQRSERLHALARELGGVEQAIPDLETGLAEAAQDESEALTARDAALGDINQGEQQALGLRSEDDKRAQESRRLLAEIAALEGRIRGLEATIESHEGLAHGTRSVLDAVESGALPDRYLPVGEAIEVDAKLALAIEVALGAAVNDLIVPTERDAKAAIEYLKTKRAGRATFQPISLMRTVDTSGADRAANAKGVLGRAALLVRYREEHAPVIESLLGRVLVAETLDDALALARGSGFSRIVTLEGEVVHASGAVTGGTQAKQGFGIVQRKAELAGLQKDLSARRKGLQAEEKAAAERARERTTLEQTVAAARKELEGLERTLNEAREFRRRVEDELKSTRRQLDRLASERDQLGSEETIASEPVDLAAAEACRDAALERFAQASADAEQAESRLREHRSRRDQASTRLESAQRRLEASKQSEAARESRLAHIEPGKQQAAEQRESAAKDRAEAESRAQEAALKLADLAATRHDLLEQSLKLAEEAKQARETANTIAATSHQSEVARARAEAKRAGAVTRLVEEYGYDEPGLEELAGQPPTELPADATLVAGRLRREIRAMGEVNLGAIEAFERLTRRFDELSVQRDDVLGGIQEVESGIRELDQLTRDRFLGTFEKVRDEFSALFTKLFGGGEGFLSLSDTENLLESGVDVEVTLPGKRRQALQLLSGGERSLCGCAFLFALLAVKPSPLVVLDEVDAPLDGRNVERFVSLLEEFSDRCQFIVITHNPTTIAAAPTWLGVTMQEPGVSMLAPARPPMESREDAALALVAGT